MKRLIYVLISTAIIALAACESEDDTTPEATGTVQLEFDNMAGTSQITLAEPGSQAYTFETSTGQAFNLNTLSYYISEIQLSGPNGELYVDEMNVSANADEIKGYYYIDESMTASQYITLHNVPVGKYDKVSFTVGIAEEGVQKGAAGGILDPAEGAPFWNWNAGYISLSIQGTTEKSPQEEVSGHHGHTPEKSFSLHIGGWKDIAPADGETQKFYNNVKSVTLDFGVAVTVSEKLSPAVHIVTDVVKILGDIDFTTTYTVHSPAGGVPFANNLTSAFTVDHVHQ